MSFQLSRALAQGRKAGRPKNRAELLNNLLRKREAAQDASGDPEPPVIAPGQAESEPHPE